MFGYFRNTKISYGVTVCNESKEVERLLNILLLAKDKRDELIVLQDVTLEDALVTSILKKFSNEVIWLREKLNGDFATFKNHLIKKAKGNYLFQIDADEVPNVSLLSGIKTYIKKKKKSDCFMVPRINKVTGITKEYIEKWNLVVNEQGYINFPDYQPRILKLNKKIFWVNKVHEELRGYSNLEFLPANSEEFCLYHIKDLDRQIRQNEFYDSMGD